MKLPGRRKAHAPINNAELAHIDANLLRAMGLNPDDFRDAFEGRNSSALFTPFRHPRDR
jgi:hypothetical protein